MKCFNCGREFDEKHPEIACTMVNTENEEDANIRKIVLHKQTKFPLALCHYCVRAVTIGFVNAKDDLPYKIKDIEYEYMEDKDDAESDSSKG